MRPLYFKMTNWSRSRQHPTFEESRVKLEFDPAFSICKFDAHPYFRWLSGMGLKGVDFLLLTEEILILVEVKNFCINVEDTPSKNQHLDLDRLTSDLIKKRAGVQIVLETITRYYARNWVYRFVKKGFNRFPWFPYFFKEWYFWTTADNLLKSGRSTYTAIVYAPAINSPTFAQLQQQLNTHEIHIIQYTNGLKQTDLPPFIQKLSLKK